MVDDDVDLVMQHKAAQEDFSRCILLCSFISITLSFGRKYSHYMHEKEYLSWPIQYLLMGEVE